MQTSDTSVRPMTDRHAISLGHGTTARPLPSVSTASGSHTAFAKSPPSRASPSTICCAPDAPSPGIGAINATAIAIRRISQPPHPQRPSRAVSNAPVTTCHASRNPARMKIPPLNMPSICPSTGEPLSPKSLRNPSSLRVPASSAANRFGSTLCPAASRSPTIPSNTAIAPIATSSDATTPVARPAGRRRRPGLTVPPRGASAAK